MAEEKNKKIIIASEDSDDEYTSDKVSEQHAELSSILDKLSLGPKKEKKKLLVLSLSGLLLHRVHIKNKRKKPKNRSPDASCGPNLVYKRPFADKFMKFCLERFEVGIWSSACERNVDMILSIILEDLEEKLLFLWDQKKCTNSGFMTLENSDKPLFFKDLSKVFSSFKGFSAANTIVIDDEPYKALLNPDSTDPEGEFCSYLDDLANASDVQAYIKEHPFGQPKIDSSHPDWSFYSKVTKMLS